MYGLPLSSEEERKKRTILKYRKIINIVFLFSFGGFFCGWWAFQNFLVTFYSLIFLCLTCLVLSIIVFINWKHHESIFDSKGRSLLASVVFLGAFLLCLYFIPGYIKDYPLYLDKDFKRVEGIPSSVDTGRYGGSIVSVKIDGKRHEVGTITKSISPSNRNKYFVIYYLPHSGFTVDFEVHGIVKD